MCYKYEISVHVYMEFMWRISGLFEFCTPSRQFRSSSDRHLLTVPSIRNDCYGELFFFRPRSIHLDPASSYSETCSLLAVFQVFAQNLYVTFISAVLLSLLFCPLSSPTLTLCVCVSSLKTSMLPSSQLFFSPSFFVHCLHPP